MKKKVLIICLVAAIIAVGGLGTYKIMKSRTFQFFGGITSRVDTQEMAVALTFDDGPTPRTDKILKVLDEENVKATFFLVGSSIEKYPEETGKLVKDGQEIGNHTYTHRRMIFVSYGAVQTEIEETDRLIREAGYTGEILFRPPNCKKLFVLPYYLSQNNRRTVTFDIEPNSYPETNASAQSIADYVIENARPGSIILLHPMYDDYSLDAIALIIQGLKEKGYAFKTVSELLQLEE